jgi:tetratricopeptide (TPR) repeat protein
MHRTKGTTMPALLARSAALAWAITLASGPLSAQSPGQTPPVDHDAREQRRAALYRQGVVLADAGRWAEAVEKFRQVVALRSAPPALFTLGQAEEKLGRLATAERTYERALADARASGNSQVADASIRAIASLTPNVPRVVVRIDDHGARVDPKTVLATVDGIPIPLETPTKFDPGDHVIAARATGMSTFTTKAVLLRGRTFEVLVAFVPTLAPSKDTVISQPAPGASSNQRPKPDRPFPIGPALLAGAGLALGAVGYLVRAAGESDYEGASAKCAGGRCPTQGLVDDANAGRSQMVLGTVVLGLGIATVAGAGMWWALGEEPTKAAKVGLRVSPAPQNAGAWLVGRF